MSENSQPQGLRAIVAELGRKRWWVLASVVLFTVAFASVAFLMQPVYSSATILVPANTGRENDVLGSALGQLGGLASLAGVGLNLGGKGSETEEALAVLRSREFTESFIRDHDLMPKLFADKWNAGSKSWDGKAPTPARAYRRFNEKVRGIAQDRRTTLVTLTIEWTDREEAAQWANELVRRINQEMRTRAIKNADASLGYLEKELQTTGVVPTREALSRLIEAQVKQRMLANVTQEYAFRVVDRALPADADDPVRPKKLLLLAAGPFLGLAVGILLVLLGYWMRVEAAGAADR